MRSLFAPLVLLLGSFGIAFAADSDFKQFSMSKMMSQAVLFQVPGNFHLLTETLNGTNYSQQWVPEGEQTWNWNQMISIGGNKDLAVTADVSPAYFATQLALSFKRKCPEGYAGADLGAMKVGSFDAHAAVVNCPQLFVNGQARSETVVMIAIKGQRDYFSLQWSERVAASNTVFDPKDAGVLERRARLAGAKLCKTTTGGTLTSSSCVE
jgi:hypothetical protein